MKIKMMSRWNVSCGVSTHAELVGRAWVQMGHDVEILAPIETNLDNIIQKDDVFVRRCYTLGEGWRGSAEPVFDHEPFINDECDVFVVQNLEMLPMEDFLRVYPIIRKKSPTVLVIHEGGPPKNPHFYMFDWDAVVCFDERYKNFLKNIFPEEKIYIIPYPCHPVKKGNRLNAREKLNLPANRKIIFNYGIGVFRHIHYLPTLNRINSRDPLIFLTITSVKDWYELFSLLKSRYDFIDLRPGPITIDELYKYLHASDVLLIHKDTADAVVVSSTAYLCMGAGCPLLVSDTNFFETLNNEVIKFRGLKDFTKKLMGIFNEEKWVRESLKAAEKYVTDHSPEKIGEKFLELFDSLRTRTSQTVSIFDFARFNTNSKMTTIENALNKNPDSTTAKNPSKKIKRKSETHINTKSA